MNIKYTEVPELLKDNILYCRRLNFSKNLKTVIVLLKNLYLYEFQNNHLVNSISLDRTILKKIKFKFECSSVDNGEITFGKYIYQNFEYKKMYILIKCWDKLVILHRNGRLQVEAEYENVKKFSITSGNMNYQASLSISFLPIIGQKLVIRRDFQENVDATEDEPASSKLKNEFSKKIFAKIKAAKTELSAHKTITQREYKKLKSFSTFGCNYIRSFRIDEKIIISKYGDIWARLTPHNDFIIGVPLFNNRNSPRLTILRNLYPIIKWDDDTSDVQYDFQFYQLKEDNFDLESSEYLFEIHNQRKKWMRNAEFILLPQSFSVLLIKVKLSSILLHCHKNKHHPLILYYELIMPDENEINSDVFPLQYFVHNLKFNEVLEKQCNYTISFNPPSFHQDLLALMYASEEFHLTIECESQSSSQRFKEIFRKKLHFEEIVSDKRDDHIEEEINKVNECQILFFNNKIDSIWFGVLAVVDIEFQKASHRLTASWSFFANTIEKSILLAKIIANETMIVGCDDYQIKLLREKQSNMLNMKKFENSIRKELCETMNVYKDNVEIQEEKCMKSFEKLLHLQMQTDLVLKQINES